MHVGLISYVTQIQFEFGAIRHVRAECERIEIVRPLICTDPGVVTAGLQAMGIGPECYAEAAHKALNDHCHATNPRPPTHADYVAMLAAST